MKLLELASHKRDIEEEEKLQKVEIVKLQKEEGKVRQHENSRYAQLYDDIEREHAEIAAKNAKDL